LKHASWCNVVHATSCGNCLSIASVKIHPVALNRIVPDGQRVDARQHRARGQLERVVDRATERQIGEAGSFVAGVKPCLGEFVSEGFADVEHVEVGRVVEAERSCVTGPGHIEEAIANSIVK
jgi:hypothetical protein